MGAVFCILPILLFLRFEFIHCKYSVAAADFMTEQKFECHFTNGTQSVLFMYRVFYNQEEIVYFNSSVGYFIPKTEIGRRAAEQMNKNKDFIEQEQKAVEIFCKYNYEIWCIVTLNRKVEPSIRVSLMPQHEGSDTEQHILLCNVFGFFPSEIEVKWYRNGQEETNQVQSIELFQNGDWSFQIHVMLETDIQKEDTFACEVHHKSLKTPKRVTWHPETSDSARNKLATGIVGFVLGAVFIVVGCVIYIRALRAQTISHGPQSEPLQVSRASEDASVQRTDLVAGVSDLRSEAVNAEGARGEVAADAQVIPGTSGQSDFILT
ncbi:class II histocompatibility antigen, B-L beta chain-like [Mixophyes fleayi]|uniref:class II histocompatibility antigen, B-L beta chain-like n=1 Tax=Mixophyes fleayi TaxID=3061075 RepID=UPI003F4E0F01